MSEPQGPVHLDLPEDVALAPATRTITAAMTPLSKIAPAPRCRASRKAGELHRHAPSGPIAVIGSSARCAWQQPGAAARVDRAAQPAVRHDDHGQGPDRRRPSAVARLHRARRAGRSSASFMRSRRSRSSGSATTRSKSNTRPGSATCRCCTSTSRRPTSTPSVNVVARSHRRSRRIARARSPPSPAGRTHGRTTRSPSTARRSSGAAARDQHLHRRMRRSTPCAARCRAKACSRSTSARTRTRSRASGPRTRRDLPHHQRLVVDGLRPARRRSRRSSRGPTCRWSACSATAASR